MIKEEKNTYVKENWKTQRKQLKMILMEMLYQQK